MGELLNEPILDSHVSQTEELQIADHRVGSSSGLVTIVVMNLFYLSWQRGERNATLVETTSGATLF